MELEIEYLRWLLINDIIKITNNKFSQNKKYEMTNIIERWLLNMSNIPRETVIDPVFIKISIDDPINLKLLQEMEEKLIFNNSSERQYYLNHIHKQIELFIDNIQTIIQSPHDNAIILNNTFYYKKFSITLDDNRINVLYNKLKQYDYTTSTNLITCMLLRYSSIIGNGQQWSMPYDNYKYLYDIYSAKVEGFASPINSQLLLINPDDTFFCSLFKDTDAIFGSLGNFFNINIKQGTIIVNPPYVPKIIDDAIIHIKKLIEQATIANKHLRIICIMPYWNDYNSIIELINYQHTKYYEILKKHAHFYESSVNGGYKIISKFNSIIFVIEANGKNRDYSDVATNMKI